MSLKKPLSPPPPKVGDLRVELLKVSGEGLIKGARARCMLQLGPSKLLTECIRIPKDKGATLQWTDAKFTFPISQPTDTLVVVLYNNDKKEDDPKGDVPVGRATIALNHLPSDKAIERWYQLTSKEAGGSTTAVLQLRLECVLSYSVARQNQDQGMTVFPAYRATLESPLELLGGNPEVEPAPRFIDYFLIVGVPPADCVVAGRNPPQILERYPETDRQDLPLPANIALFCFPASFKVSTAYKESLCFPFKLTDGMLSIYGQVLVYWTPIPLSRLKSQTPAPPPPPPGRTPTAAPASAASSSLVYIPKAVCIISRYPYLPQFRAILSSLFQRFFLPHIKREREENSLSGDNAGNTATEDEFDELENISDLEGEDASAVRKKPAAPKKDKDEPSRPASLSVVVSPSGEPDPGAGPSRKTSRASPSSGDSAPGKLVKSGSSNSVRDKLLSDRAMARQRAASNTPSPQSAEEKKERFRKAEQRRQATLAGSGSGTPPMNPEWMLDSDGRSLEQYVTYFCEEVPLPIAGKTSVGFRIGDFPILISLPPRELEFPQLELPLESLFRILDMRTVLHIMCCIFTECQLLFHSTQYSLLLFVQECILSLCFPFTWEHVYIPLLPKEMINIIQAPVPFIVGIHTDILPEDIDDLWQSTNVVVVDIDRSEIDSNMPPPFFPAQQTRTLARSVMGLIRPQTFQADHTVVAAQTQGPVDAALPSSTSFQNMYPLPPSASSQTVNNLTAPPAGAAATAQSAGVPLQKISPAPGHVWAFPINVTLQRALRSTFLHFIADLLKDYRNFVFFVNGKKPIFNTAKFLQHHQGSLQFLSRFLETQLFTNFLERHVECPGYLDDYLTYIDNLTATKLRRDNTAFSGGLLTFMVPLPPRLNVDDLLAKDQQATQANGGVAPPVTPLSLRPKLLLKERFAPPRKIKLPVPSTEESDNESSSASSTDSDSESESSGLRSSVAHKIAAATKKRTRPLPASAPGAVEVKANPGAPRKSRYTGRLQIKSLIEQSKELEECRLYELLRRILLVSSETGIAGETEHDVDMGELSAVGELLRFPHWRTALANYFPDHNVAETRTSTSSFKCLTLLFNIAIEECHFEEDYSNAKALLDMSMLIYTVPEETRPPQSGHLDQPEVLEREYLRSAIKAHHLWEEPLFWSFCYDGEIAKYRKRIAREKQEAGAAAAAPAAAAAAAADKVETKESYENFLFDLIGKMAYTMLSLGLSVETATEFTLQQCERGQFLKEHRATVSKLVSNIHMSVPPSPSSSAATSFGLVPSLPLPTPRGPPQLFSGLQAPIATTPSPSVSPASRPSLMASFLNRDKGKDVSPNASPNLLKKL